MATLYEDHVARVYGFFAYRVSAVPTAEDLTAMTFERAVKNGAKFDPRRGAPVTWLFAIAQNVLIDHYRWVGRHAEVLADHEALDVASRAHASHDDLSLGLDPELETALAGLGERERQVIALRFGAELRGKEIARLTGLTEANVHQIISRGLRQLRRSMPVR